MPTALIVLADGFEEMEAVAPIDLLRRAGVEVTVAGVPATTLTGRNGMTFVADRPLAEVAQDAFDLVVVPGGPAAQVLREEAALLALLQRHAERGALLAAICAAPTVLAAAGVLEDHAYTAHFSVAEELPSLDRTRAVVTDRRVITSQGAGTATAFALALVRALVGEQAAQEVAAAICYGAGEGT